MSDALQVPEGEEVEQLLPRKPSPWGMVAIIAVGVVAASFSAWLYNQMPQRGMTLKTEGHVTKLPDGTVWALTLDGFVVRVAKASVDQFKLETGPCTKLAGTLEEPEFLLEFAECTPGPVLRRIGERMKLVGVKFGYWTGIESKNETMEPWATGIEYVAAMIDPRFDNPQIVTLYSALAPETVFAERAKGAPPPVVIQVQRNDFMIKRMTKPELAQFLDVPKLIVGAGGAKGGWVVREVEVVAEAPTTLERLLTSPADPEILKLLAVGGPMKVSRRGDLVVPAVAPGVPPPPGP